MLFTVTVPNKRKLYKENCFPLIHRVRVQFIRLHNHDSKKIRFKSELMLPLIAIVSKQGEMNVCVQLTFFFYTIEDPDTCKKFDIYIQ